MWRPGPPQGPFLIAGLGRAGRAAAHALAKRNPPREVTAWGGKVPPWGLVAGEEAVPSGVRTRFGGDGTDLLGTEPRPRCLIKSPGIPFTHSLIEAAEGLGMTVIDEAELAWRLDRRPLIAVTGTNGKSTVVALIESILGAAGRRPLVGGNTQFDPPLSAIVDEEGDAVVAEISSFQLEGCPKLLPEAAVLTNLTPHHLIRHGTVTRYAELKRRLFVRGERAVGLAVLNVDDPFGLRLAADVRARGGSVAGFGRAEEAEYRIVGCEWTLSSATVALATPTGPIELLTRLPGRHNALNVAAALALVGCLEIPLGQAAEAIGRTEAVPGRLEVVAGRPFHVLVDFAHSPEGIRAALETVRGAGDRSPHGRVITVLSAVPTVNDAAERHAMGAAARAHSDLLVLTSERWTPREPSGVLPELVDGARTAGGQPEVVPDRRAAIQRAVTEARDGDVVVVLGRGARRGHLLDAENRPRRFDDRAEVRAALGARLR